MLFYYVRSFIKWPKKNPSHTFELKLSIKVLSDRLQGNFDIRKSSRRYFGQLPLRHNIKCNHRFRIKSNKESSLRMFFPSNSFFSKDLPHIKLTLFDILIELEQPLLLCFRHWKILNLFRMSSSPSVIYLIYWNDLPNKYETKIAYLILFFPIRTKYQQILEYLFIYLKIIYLQPKLFGLHVC